MVVVRVVLCCKAKINYITLHYVILNFAAGSGIVYDVTSYSYIMYLYMADVCKHTIII